MATAITKSTVDSTGAVVQAPASLLAAAREKIGDDLSEEEYALARVVSSEFGSGPVVAQVAIADATLNRIGRESVLTHVTGGSGRYGRQGGVRPMSSARDPSSSHVDVARRALGPDRGISRGATQFFDPRTQYACWSRPSSCTGGGTGLNHHQHPLAIVESWCYEIPRLGCDRDEQGRYRCAYGDRGRAKRSWVGQISGVNPYDLMLIGPLAVDADAVFERARSVIVDGIAGRSAVYDGPGTWTLLGALAAWGWWRS